MKNTFKRILVCCYSRRSRWGYSLVIVLSVCVLVFKIIFFGVLSFYYRTVRYHTYTYLYVISKGYVRVNQEINTKRQGMVLYNTPPHADLFSGSCLCVGQGCIVSSSCFHEQHHIQQSACMLNLYTSAPIHAPHPPRPLYNTSYPTHEPRYHT